MQQRVIIFDMDGTLIDSSVTIANAINYVRNNLGFEPLEREYIIRLINDHTINPAQKFYHAKTFEKQHEIWFSEYYSEHHHKDIELYQGIPKLLEKLKSHGAKLAIATNAYRISTIESLSHLKVQHHFDAIACYDDVAQGKPYPDMLYKVLDEVRMQNHQALFIGDGPRDQMASESANIEYIMVDWGFSDHDNAVRSVAELEKIIFGEI